MTQYPPRPGEDRDDSHHEAVHEHEDDRVTPIMEDYQRHEHEEFEEAVDEAEDAQHAFDEAVGEAEHEAEHLTDG